jgi:hypothetical protein
MLLQCPEGEPITLPEHQALLAGALARIDIFNGSGERRRILKRFNWIAESIHLISSMCFLDLELSMGVFP